MIEDLPLHFRREVIIAIMNREPVVIPVTTSRVKSQAGFEAFWCLEGCWTGLCFGLPPECDAAGGAPPPTTVIVITNFSDQDSIVNSYCGDGQLIRCNVESLRNELVTYLDVQIQDLGINILNLLVHPQTIPYETLPLVAQKPKHNGLIT